MSLTANRKLRCLVVDDSTIFRKVVRDVLNEHPEIEVVGVAPDGMAAVDRIRDLKPDLLTLDIEMPNLDGLGVLRKIKELNLPTDAIMLSAFTAQGAKTTTTALGLGAFDFILKPSSSNPQESVNQLKRDLIPKVDAFLQKKRYTKPAPSLPTKPQAPQKSTVSVSPKESLCRPSVIVIGVSTGGPQALTQVIPMLPETLSVPVVIVQHMPPLFTKSLAEDLDNRSKLSVYEAQSGQRIEAGGVYIAPGGNHLKLGGTLTGPIALLTEDPPERNCRPAVDYLFRSAAKMYGQRTLGIVMTGMGDDGTNGSRAIREVGGSIVAQDESSCVVYGMPQSVVNNNLANKVVPLQQIASLITNSVRNRSKVLA